ncbi:MAG: LuxR C-terminal-related transcriptional regulator [Acidimicrobiales bacterium]
MDLLEAADAHAVLGTVGRLAVHPPPGFATVCELLRDLIPCESASFNDMALGSGDFRYVIVPDDNAELAAELKPAYDRFFHQHPLILRAAGMPLAGALRFCDVPGGDEVTDTDLYREFYEPFGLRYQMVIQLPAPPAVVVGYALNRTEQQGEFSDRDAAVLNALEGHLAMHHRVVEELERSRAMEVEADRDGWSVVTVRSDGVVERSSSHSLAQGLSPGETVPAGVASLLPIHGDPDRGATSHDVVIDGDHWRCVVHPVAVGPTVLLVRHLGQERAEHTALIDAGLTGRQAEVALALARTGAGNAQLARSLVISEGTVKKHLEAVFRILRVDNRAAAAVAVSDLVGGPG